MKSIRFAAIFFLFIAFQKCHPPAGPANIVFILVDDLGWTDLHCYPPGGFYETPNIDALALSGMRFTSAYTASPVCSPTRASILTGQHPARIGITDWIPGVDPQDRMLVGPDDRHNLPLEYRTLAEVLKDDGYATCFVGKWHLGHEGFYPEDQGFDVNIGGHHKGSPPGGYYSPYENPELTDGAPGEYLTDRLTTEAIRFLESHRDEPCFVYLNYYTVHTPIQACERHLDRFRLKQGEMNNSEVSAFRPERDGHTKLLQDDPAYASMIYALDENVGRLLRKIQELDPDNRSYVIFFSDNGGLSTTRREWAPTSNEPLRAGKGWCYEGGIRVPLIIAGKGINEGSVSDLPVMSTDLYPTLLALAGTNIPDGSIVDGEDLSPVLYGGPIPEQRDLFWHYPHYHGSTWTPGSAIRSGKWKLVRFDESRTSELYDLKADLSEAHDLSEALPGKAEELEEKLEQWLRSVDAQRAVPNPDKSTLLK